MSKGSLPNTKRNSGHTKGSSGDGCDGKNLTQAGLVTPASQGSSTLGKKLKKPKVPESGARKQLCGKCAESGRESKLRFYQIHINEAILMCEHAECTFSLTTSCVVTRDFSSVKRLRHKLPLAYRSLPASPAPSHSSGSSASGTDPGCSRSSSPLSRTTSDSCLIARGHRRDSTDFRLLVGDAAGDCAFSNGLTNDYFHHYERQTTEEFAASESDDLSALLARIEDVDFVCEPSSVEAEPGQFVDALEELIDMDGDDDCVVPLDKGDNLGGGPARRQPGEQGSGDALANGSGDQGLEVLIQQNQGEKTFPAHSAPGLEAQNVEQAVSSSTASLEGGEEEQDIAMFQTGDNAQQVTPSFVVSDNNPHQSFVGGEMEMGQQFVVTEGSTYGHMVDPCTSSQSMFMESNAPLAQSYVTESAHESPDETSEMVYEDNMQYPTESGGHFEGAPESQDVYGGDEQEQVDSSSHVPVAGLATDMAISGAAVESSTAYDNAAAMGYNVQPDQSEGFVPGEEGSMEAQQMSDNSEANTVTTTVQPSYLERRDFEAEALDSTSRQDFYPEEAACVMAEDQEQGGVLVEQSATHSQQAVASESQAQFAESETASSFDKSSQLAAQILSRTPQQMVGAQQPFSQLPDQYAEHSEEITEEEVSQQHPADLQQESQHYEEPLTQEASVSDVGAEMVSQVAGDAAEEVTSSGFASSTVPEDPSERDAGDYTTDPGSMEVEGHQEAPGTSEAVHVEARELAEDENPQHQQYQVMPDSDQTFDYEQAQAESHQQGSYQQTVGYEADPSEEEAQVEQFAAEQPDELVQSTMHSVGQEATAVYDQSEYQTVHSAEAVSSGEVPSQEVDLVHSEQYQIAQPSDSLESAQYQVPHSGELVESEDYQVSQSGEYVQGQEYEAAPQLEQAHELQYQIETSDQGGQEQEYQEQEYQVGDVAEHEQQHYQSEQPAEADYQEIQTSEQAVSEYPETQPHEEQGQLHQYSHLQASSTADYQEVPHQQVQEQSVDSFQPVEYSEQSQPAEYTEQAQPVEYMEQAPADMEQYVVDSGQPGMSSDVVQHEVPATFHQQEDQFQVVGQQASVGEDSDAVQQQVMSEEVVGESSMEVDASDMLAAASEIAGVTPSETAGEGTGSQDTEVGSDSENEAFVPVAIETRRVADLESEKEAEGVTTSMEQMAVNESAGVEPREEMQQELGQAPEEGVAQPPEQAGQSQFRLVTAQGQTIRTIPASILQQLQQASSSGQVLSGSSVAALLQRHLSQTQRTGTPTLIQPKQTLLQTSSLLTQPSSLLQTASLLQQQSQQTSLLQPTSLLQHQTQEASLLQQQQTTSLLQPTSLLQQPQQTTSLLQSTSLLQPQQMGSASSALQAASSLLKQQGQSLVPQQQTSAPPASTPQQQQTPQQTPPIEPPLARILQDMEATAVGTQVVNLFVQWQNVDALCWLDVLLCPLVHSPTMTALMTPQRLKELEGTILCALLKAYHHAQGMLEALLTRSAQQEAQAQASNTAPPYGIVNKANIADIGQAVGVLYTARENIWKAMQPRLRCEKGKHDSPVFAMPLLVRENPEMKKLFTIRYRLVFACQHCGYSQDDKHHKIMPSLPAVPQDFSSAEPSFLRPCFQCGAPDQRMRMLFEDVQDFFLLHFVNGIPHNRFHEMDFSFGDSDYTVTSVVQYKRNPDHFICWIRNAPDHSWMECDDLKSVLTRFTPGQPCIPPSQVHIVMWERNVTPAHARRFINTPHTNLLASLVLTVQYPSSTATSTASTATTSTTTAPATAPASTITSPVTPTPPVQRIVYPPAPTSGGRGRGRGSRGRGRGRGQSSHSTNIIRRPGGSTTSSTPGKQIIYTMGTPTGLTTQAPSVQGNQRIVVLKSSTGGLQAVNPASLSPAILEVLKKQGLNVGALKGTIMVSQAGAQQQQAGSPMTSLLAKPATVTSTTDCGESTQSSSEASEAVASLVSSMQEEGITSPGVSTSSAQLQITTQYQIAPATSTIQFPSTPGMTSLLSSSGSSLLLPGKVLMPASSTTPGDSGAKPQSMLGSVLTSADHQHPLMVASSEGQQPMLVRQLSSSADGTQPMIVRQIGPNTSGAATSRMATLGTQSPIFRIMSSGGKAIQVRPMSSSTQGGRRVVMLPGSAAGRGINIVHPAPTTLSPSTFSSSGAAPVRYQLISKADGTRILTQITASPSSPPPPSSSVRVALEGGEGGTRLVSISSPSRSAHEVADTVGFPGSLTTISPSASSMVGTPLLEARSSNIRASIVDSVITSSHTSTTPIIISPPAGSVETKPITVSASSPAVNTVLAQPEQPSPPSQASHLDSDPGAGRSSSPPLLDIRHHLTYRSEPVLGAAPEPAKEPEPVEDEVLSENEAELDLVGLADSDWKRAKPSGPTPRGAKRGRGRGGRGRGRGRGKGRGKGRGMAKIAPSLLAAEEMLPNPTVVRTVQLVGEAAGLPQATFPSGDPASADSQDNTDSSSSLLREMPASEVVSEESVDMEVSDNSQNMYSPQKSSDMEATTPNASVVTEAVQSIELGSGGALYASSQVEQDQFGSAPSYEEVQDMSMEVVEQEVVTSELPLVEEEVTVGEEVVESTPLQEIVPMSEILEENSVQVVQEDFDTGRKGRRRRSGGQSPRRSRKSSGSSSLSPRGRRKSSATAAEDTTTESMEVEASALQSSLVSSPFASPVRGSPHKSPAASPTTGSPLKSPAVSAAEGESPAASPVHSPAKSPRKSPYSSPTRKSPQASPTRMTSKSPHGSPTRVTVQSPGQDSPVKSPVSSPQRLQPVYEAVEGQMETVVESEVKASAETSELTTTQEEKYMGEGPGTSSAKNDEDLDTEQPEKIIPPPKKRGRKRQLSRRSRQQTDEVVLLAPLENEQLSLNKIQNVDEQETAERIVSIPSPLLTARPSASSELASTSTNDPSQENAPVVPDQVEEQSVGLAEPGPSSHPAENVSTQDAESVLPQPQADCSDLCQSTVHQEVSELDDSKAAPVTASGKGRKRRGRQSKGRKQKPQPASMGQEIELPSEEKIDIPPMDLETSAEAPVDDSMQQDVEKANQATVEPFLESVNMTDATVEEMPLPVSPVTPKKRRGGWRSKRGSVEKTSEVKSVAEDRKQMTEVTAISDNLSSEDGTPAVDASQALTSVANDTDSSVDRTGDLQQDVAEEAVVAEPSSQGEVEPSTSTPIVLTPSRQQPKQRRGRPPKKRRQPAAKKRSTVPADEKAEGPAEPLPDADVSVGEGLYDKAEKSFSVFVQEEKAEEAQGAKTEVCAVEAVQQAEGMEVDQAEEVPPAVEEVKAAGRVDQDLANKKAQEDINASVCADEGAPFSIEKLAETEQSTSHTPALPQKKRGRPRKMTKSVQKQTTEDQFTGDLTNVSMQEEEKVDYVARGDQNAMEIAETAVDSAQTFDHEHAAVVSVQTDLEQKVSSSESPAPAKRGRGRPPKSVTKPTKENTDGNVEAQVLTDSQQDQVEASSNFVQLNAEKSPTLDQTPVTLGKKQRGRKKGSGKLDVIISPKNLAAQSQAESFPKATPSPLKTTNRAVDHSPREKSPYARDNIFDIMNEVSPSSRGKQLGKMFRKAKSPKGKASKDSFKSRSPKGVSNNRQASLTSEAVVVRRRSYPFNRRSPAHSAIFSTPSSRKLLMQSAHARSHSQGAVVVRRRPRPLASPDILAPPLASHISPVRPLGQTDYSEGYCSVLVKRRKPADWSVGSHKPQESSHSDQFSRNRDSQNGGGNSGRRYSRDKSIILATVDGREKAAMLTDTVVVSASVGAGEDNLASTSVDSSVLKEHSAKVLKTSQSGKRSRTSKGHVKEVETSVQEQRAGASVGSVANQKALEKQSSVSSADELGSVTECEEKTKPVTPHAPDGWLDASLSSPVSEGSSSIRRSSRPVVPSQRMKESGILKRRLSGSEATEPNPKKIKADV